MAQLGKSSVAWQHLRPATRSALDIYVSELMNKCSGNASIIRERFALLVHTPVHPPPPPPPHTHIAFGVRMLPTGLKHKYSLSCVCLAAIYTLAQQQTKFSFDSARHAMREEN